MNEIRINAQCGTCDFVTTVHGHPNLVRLHNGSAAQTDKQQAINTSEFPHSLKHTHIRDSVLESSCYLAELIGILTKQDRQCAYK
jgi:hypothetical protein